MHPYIIPLAKKFEQHADPEVAANAKAYLRSQFEFFGIMTGPRRDLYKSYMKQSVPVYKDLGTITKELWQLPQRDFQYFATELLAKYKKEWRPGIIQLFEYMITHKSWWDSVDHIASELTGPYFILFPEKILTVTGKWNKSNSIWLQRSSILFQKAYKNRTDTELLSGYILHCAGSKEFFVQKAIGWALREYSKTDPKWVKKFVAGHNLSPFIKREALKRIK